ncbi:hypothetical protein KP509_02G102700 [Ceratopteris richardii]|uniref:NmrA-like domain-containing protein n=1 Tax=Ceratopteris richardii TaxID=49495 RepID=A0A8T2V979_CERRI|nr:hypothetical protein KP509_02G102700 [Ceratopteris richardii]
MGSTEKILVIGATGGLGRHVVAAGVSCGCPTYAFVRPQTVDSDPAKAALLRSFESSGANILEGSLEDYDSLLAAVKQVDIVISCLNLDNHASELKILKAIQEADAVKRLVFIDFVAAQDIELYGLLKSISEPRKKVIAAVIQSGVPFTRIMTYGFASYYLASLGQLNSRSPPSEKVIIAATGDVKAYMVAEEDIGMYTVKASLDPRAENKNVHLRLPKNHLSQHEMVSLWESKSGKPLERLYESEEELSKSFEDAGWASFPKLLKHFAFVKGGHNGSLKRESGDVEVMELYPDFDYISADQYLNRFLL